MARVTAVCTSPQKGTAKSNVGEAFFRINHGIVGDAHAGDWHRQISLISKEKVDAFKLDGAEVVDGDFGENLVVTGIDFSSLPLGTLLECNGVVLEITQIGKECHNHCQIYQRMGDCIMPREGVFARVLQEGFIAVGDEMHIKPNNDLSDNCTDHKPDNRLGIKIEPPKASYSVAIVVSSDKGFRGEREDLSGKAIEEIALKSGFEVVSYTILPDERELLSAELIRLADELKVDLVLTTGGTGFAQRDCTPEATLSVATRSAPGIAEAVRAMSLTITKRAMLSRAQSVIRNKTLIINLPGSPKAVREILEFIIDELKHGLDVLCDRAEECAQS